MADPGDLHAFASLILDAAVDALDSIPTYPATASLDGAPARSYVSAGLPVDDCCEQIVVWVDPVGLRPGRSDAKRAAFVTEVTIHVQTGRCLPMPEVSPTGAVTLPEAAALEAAAAQVNADGWALWNGILGAIYREEIASRCLDVDAGPLSARSASGGCGGWTLTIRAGLLGYTPDVT